MELSTIVSVIFPIAIGLVMFGLGLALHITDFTRIFKSPAPVLIGLLTQVVVLPLTAFFICKSLGLSPELAIGVMILSASPTGPTANIFSRFSNGDIALGLTLSALGSVLSAVTLPLISGLAVQHFSGSTSEVSFEFRKSFDVVFIILFAVALGVLIREKRAALASKLDRLLRIFSVLVLALIIVTAVSKEWATLTANIGQIGWIVILYNLTSLGIGFFFPRLLKLPRDQAISISMGAGIHNATLGIFMALSVLGNTVYALPSALYGILMFFTATALTLYFKKKN